MKLPTAEQMRALDNIAISHYGIPSIVLMENAGRGMVAAMGQEFGNLAGRTITILVGPGNNGGDGLVIARHLHQQHARPHVLLLSVPDKFTGDAAVNLAVVQKLGLPLRQFSPGDSSEMVRGLLRHSWLVVDAIFGTGLKREVSGHFAEVIELLNQLHLPVAAVDIPSGLNADTGQPLGVCVQASMTATFAHAKPGLTVHPGRGLAGRLQVIDIGIPPEAAHQAAISTELLTAATLGAWLPERQASSHKGTFGHLLVVAGSEGKTGAAILCAQGAMRSGAGLVTLCVPAAVNSIFETCLTEAMTLPLPSSGKGHLSIADYEKIFEATRGKQAVAVGPGLGTAPETAEMVLRLYRQCQEPMVIDADGLNILAGEPAVLASPPGPRLLTPHPGEMSRLTGLATKAIQADRLAVASTFAREKGVFLVLKGADSVIAAPDGRLAVNPTGNPGMASGGMGDVLTGIIGGLLAQGLTPWQAACLGTYAHGAAGDRLAAGSGANLGLLASDLAREFPRTLAELTTRARQG
jgi:ADP-dependent NAD(P)H-hydrate dehydratase / NAD(P)H-hydrate epimerase